MENALKIISTSDLRIEDIPHGNFKWSKFSNFALTFDPLSETMSEFDRVSLSAIPSEKWTIVALRYFLYCWQRIANNQAELEPVTIDNIQVALIILRSKSAIRDHN
jgi:hypothetical protein